MKKTSGTLLLLLTALIWGTAFVAQRTGMDHLGPIAFQSIRALLGFLSLLPLMLLRKRAGKSGPMPTVKASLSCGAVLAVASTVQQIGLQYTTASKAGFISSLYVVLVPLIGLLLGRKPEKGVWIGVPLSVLGMYMIASVSGEGFSLGRGDWLMLASALLFACHIVVVGHFAPQADGVALSCAQFFVAGLMTLPIAFLTEHIPLAGIWEAKWALLYAGVLSCGVAYTLQIVGQKDTPPAIASLTMSLESVFSAIAGAIILHETLQPREMLGCALMLAAVMIAQLPIARQKKAA